MTLVSKTACFTGHREIRPEDKNLTASLSAVLINLIQRGYVYFGAGGARGFDALAAETVLNLKAQYPQIILILVLPFVNQYEHESGWSADEIKQYQDLKSRADKVVHLQQSYSKGCYYRRNDHLLHFSSVCISYQYKNTGGTSYTTDKAKKQGIEVINCI